MAEPTLLDLPFDVLRGRLTRSGQPAYRASQIWQAVYRDLTTRYPDMTTLPVSLRERLAESLPLQLPAPEAHQHSADRRTTKTLLRLADGEAIEAVLMRYDARDTVCVSTQIGCAMACRICATGQGGFTRDLSPGEIVGQVLHAARTFREEGEHLTNVVYMGMGEPFRNYDATLASIRILNDPRGLGLGARSFTVSTVGIVPAIERFAEEGLQVHLAVSLHTGEDELRSRLLPINRTYPLDRLLEACRTYVARTNRRITFEVALIDGVNDSPSQARALADRLRGILCHVNLIPFNPIPGAPWRRSSDAHVAEFADILDGRGVSVTVRMRRGVEIEAGCGQLRTGRSAATERDDASP